MELLFLFVHWIFLDRNRVRGVGGFFLESNFDWLLFFLGCYEYKGLRVKSFSLYLGPLLVRSLSLSLSLSLSRILVVYTIFTGSVTYTVVIDKG